MNNKNKAGNMLIIHGDNTVQSRNALFAAMENAKTLGELQKADGKTLDEAKLENLLGSNALFSENKTVVIENLLSLPKSKKKDALVELVKKTSAQVILWEGKLLTPAALKDFPKEAKLQQFKVNPAVFQFLDALFPKNAANVILFLQKAIDQDSAEMCFAMLIGRIRQLLLIKDGTEPKGAPFMIAKMKKQAEKFSLEQLLEIHTRLLEIDLAQKTSTSPLGLHGQLDLLLSTL